MEILSWVLLALFAAICIAYVVIKIISFTKLTKEEKKQKVLDLLYSLVVIAETEIKGQGKGAEKLAYVEQLFEAKAPLLYKYLVKYSGYEDLDTLIEEALAAVKASFEKG